MRSRSDDFPRLAYVQAEKRLKLAYSLSRETRDGPATVMHAIEGTTSLIHFSVKPDFASGLLALGGIPHLKGTLALKGTGALNSSKGTCGTSKFRAVALSGPGITVDLDAGPILGAKGSGSGFITQLAR